MTLLARLKNQHTTNGTYSTTGSPEATQAVFADLASKGYTLRHVYGLGDRCPMCSARLQRQEWGQRFTPTIGLNVCTCGFVSQVFTIA